MTRRIFAEDNIEASIVLINDKSITPPQYEINIFLPSIAGFYPLVFPSLSSLARDYTIRYGLTWAWFRRRSCMHATYTRAILRSTWCLESVVHARHSYIIRIKYASFSRAVYLPTSCKITTDQAPAGYTSLRDKHWGFFNRNMFRKVSLTRLTTQILIKMVDLILQI